jgi:hypothetical protein
MIPAPVAVGLHLCHNLVVQPDTHDVTLTRVFRILRTPLHPSTIRPFSAFASIHGPEGRGILRVAIFRAHDQDVLYSMSNPVEFRDRFTPVYLTLRMSHFRFPSAGEYEMMLMIDRDVIAQRVFHVVAAGVEP